MNIILAQTAAGSIHEQMLAATAPLHRAYCEANDIDFRSFVGIRRGFYPWHACYNRIEMIRDLIDDGYRGWFIYLDADTVIRQADFELRRYLGKRLDRALIAARGRPNGGRWDINDGVFFLNLGDASGREIARRWHEAFHHNVGDELLERAVEPWQHPDGGLLPDDQHLLQTVLRHWPGLDEALLREEDGLINYGGGRFIRQFVRLTGTPEERLALIRRTVELSAG